VRTQTTGKKETQTTGKEKTHPAVCVLTDCFLANGVYIPGVCQIVVCGDTIAVNLRKFSEDFGMY